MKSGDLIVINIIESAPDSDAQRGSNVFAPSMDIYECTEGLFYEIELSGVAAENIKILQENDKLIIRGKKKHDTATEKGRYHLLERPFGSFEKLLELPPDVLPENITATLRNGVLRIQVTRSSEPGAKQTSLTIN